jgi:hypothetical protein
MPGIWYELELIAPELHAAGVSLPGVPLVLIGHNADLAWGFTSVIADTQDIFIERPTADGLAVERDGRAPEPIRGPSRDDPGPGRRSGRDRDPLDQSRCDAERHPR